MVREGQNIELYRDSRTTSASLADHQWSAEQTLGITDLDTQNSANLRILRETKQELAESLGFEEPRLKNTTLTANQFMYKCKS